MRIHPAALALLAVVFAACSPAPRTGSIAPDSLPICTPWCADTVADGVVWRRATLTLPDSSPRTVLVNVVDVDLSNPAVRVRPVRLEDSTYHTVSDMGTSTAQAISGVNGGFFLNGQNDDICCACQGASCPLYRPSSLLQIPGTWSSTNCRAARSAFGIDAQGGTHFTVLPPNTGWPGMPYAIGAGPTLVQGGQPVALTDTTQSFPWIGTAHAHTAVAVDTAGHLLLVTVDVPGLTLPGFANFLVSLGARDAMNLDGGGSTTMWVAGQPNGGVVNCPSASGCTERKVYDGLFVLGG